MNLTRSVREWFKTNWKAMEGTVGGLIIIAVLAFFVMFEGCGR